MIVLAYLGALFIGVTLGVIGGGGSILTVPLLVYVLGINPILATSYSLFIVGATSVVGAFKKAKEGLVDFKLALWFALPSLTSVYTTRQFLVPNLPNVLFTYHNVVVTKNGGILLLFATLMFLAGLSMLYKRDKQCSHTSKPKLFFLFVVIQALILGVFTGLVGAGGGFLIIPMLVLFAKLPINKAIATSLVIVTFKSLIGFLGGVSIAQIDWFFLLIITSVSILGMFIGHYWSNKLKVEKLKYGFGIFVIVMSVFIFFKEIVFVN